MVKETLEKQLEQAILDKDWQSAEKLSDLLDKEIERNKATAEIQNNKQKLHVAQISAIVAAIVSLGTFLINLF